MDCDDDGEADCVKDARGEIVECPFPQAFNVRGMPNGDLIDTVCSALVKAALWAHDAFKEGDDPDPEAHIEDMILGTVMKVRPFGDRDIEFNVPSPGGKKINGWSIIFSDKQGHCSDQTLPPSPLDDFPDFLSIRALDMVGDGFADTWHIGTFVEDKNNPAGGTNDPRLACLVKHKRDEFVGFFEMSFMYTVVICEGCPSP